MKAQIFTWFLSFVTLVAFSESARAEQARDEHGYSDVAAIEKWAHQSFLGSKVQRFSKGDRELVVVSGLRTSGVATARLVVLGRRDAKSEFRELVKTAVFMGTVMIREAKNGVTVDVAGKMVLQIPFELVAAEVHTGL